MKLTTKLAPVLPETPEEYVKLLDVLSELNDSLYPLGLPMLFKIVLSSIPFWTELYASKPNFSDRATFMPLIALLIACPLAKVTFKLEPSSPLSTLFHVLISVLVLLAFEVEVVEGLPSRRCTVAIGVPLVSLR